MSTLPQITDATFATAVAASPVPTLISLGQRGCAPCKAMEPLLAKLAEEMKNRLTVAKADVEHAPVLATTLRIRATPYIALFAGEKIAVIANGSLPYDQLKARVEAALPAPTL
jgi:thioredoxin 1